MPILKKKLKQAPVKEKVPMHHEGDKISFDDGEGNILSGEIDSVDNDAETVKVLTPEGEEYELEFKEILPPVKKAGRPKEQEPKETSEEEEKPAKKGKGKGVSLAAAFSKTKAAKGGGGLPKGKHEMIVHDIGINTTEKGTSGYFKATIVNDDENEGKSGVEFFQLLNADGEVQRGLEFFKGFLEQLGLDEDTEFDDEDVLKEALDELAEKQMYVKANVVEKEGYTHIYLQEVLDQNNKPDMPPF